MKPILLLIVIYLAAPLLGQTPPAGVTQDRYEFKKEHHRDGIGKFFMGREIAHVMGHQVADWLERPERDDEEHTQTLIESLKFKPGEVVADVGAGTGYFTRRISKKVGNQGRVYAVDIQAEMLTLLTNKLKEEKVENVRAILGTTQDPKLPASAIDTILLVDVYHEFDFPYEMIVAMCQALKPGGRIVFVEFRGEDPEVPIKEHHKMTELQLLKEMSGHPLRWKETLKVLPRQHIVIFQKIPPQNQGAVRKP